MPARLFSALAAVLALAGCAAGPSPADAQAPAPPPVAPRADRPVAGPVAARPDVITGEPARELARRLLSGLADQAVEMRRSWSSPGYFLHGYELWERPAATPQTNICSVRVHRLNLAGLSEQARFNSEAPLNPEARAESVHSQTRFRAVGSTTAPVVSPSAYQAACAALDSGSGWFVAAGDSEAVTALRAFDMAQYAARDPEARMISIECVRYEAACEGRPLLARALSSSMIRSVASRACEGPADPRCWTYELFSPEEGNWTLTIHRLLRPMRVTLRQDPVPVS